MADINRLMDKDLEEIDIISGNLQRTNEVILKKNTKYLLTIQNLNNDTVFVNLNHSWYENGL